MPDSTDPECTPEPSGGANTPAAMTADQVLEAVTVLGEHLMRSGVDWLPSARPRAERGNAIERLQRSWEAVKDQPADRSASPGTVDRKHASDQDRAARDTADSSDATPEPSSADGLTARSPQQGRFATIAPVESSAEDYPGENLSPDQREAALREMAGEVAGCTRCSVLAQCRKQTVFGEGHAAPRVAFFGEGPGADEDRTGRPFVGRAGQLLTKMIEACTFRREDVYILNTIKCRPPQNRNPDPEEIANCRDYFERQLQILRPDYIVCLGAISSQTLLHSKLPVGRLRGQLHRYHSSKVIVTYHPAYLLRNPAAKKAAWADLQLMLRDAGIQP